MATTKVPATRGASSAASQRHSSVLSNSPAVSEKPGSKSKSANVCPVCCKAILDATKTRKGQEALECEGPCRKWIHRWCAGVHEQDYPTTLSNSSDPWICPSCSLKEYGQLIKALVNTVETLRAEVASLKKLVDSNSCPPHEDPKASYATVASGAVTTISSTPSTSAVQLSPTHAAPKSQQKGIFPNNPNRKFNIVVYGVNECPKGTYRQTRQSSDLSSIATIISSLNTGVKPDSISDCFRLGKFDPKRKHPRPLLVKLIRSSDVQTILVNCSKVSKPVIIKRHMSPDERINESLLLKERWNLIQSGIERKSIKIQGTRIYANKKLVGQLSNFQFNYSLSWSSEPELTSDSNDPSLAVNDSHSI